MFIFLKRLKINDLIKENVTVLQCIYMYEFESHMYFYNMYYI